jgi:hypothetical protein
VRRGGPAVAVAGLVAWRTCDLGSVRSVAEKVDCPLPSWAERDCRVIPAGAWLLPEWLWLRVSVGLGDAQCALPDMMERPGAFACKISHDY